MKRSDKIVGAKLVTDAGYVDVVNNGEVLEDRMTASVLVESQSDLADIAELYNAGTIAYTAGFKAMWQLSTAGTWVSIV